MRYQKHLTLALVGLASLCAMGSASANSLSNPSESRLQNEAYNKARLEEIRLQNSIRSRASSLPLRLEDIVVHVDFLKNEKPIAVKQDASYSSARSRFVGNVDLNKVEKTWQSWVNDLRSQQGLHPYKINHLLSNTAQEWSDFSKNRGYIIHGRPGDGCVGAKNYGCYNFSAVDKWFLDRGVNPVIKNRSKHTENLGIGAFRCKSSDCTDAAINAIRKTYDFFYKEKSYNGVHYRSMINPHFTEMGLGLAFKDGQYYLTIHYSNPLK